MVSESVILAKNVQVSKIKFSAPKKLNNGSSTVYVNYDGGKLTLQTPLMTLPYGVGDFNDKNAQDKSKAKSSSDSAEVKKYDLHVSFRGMDENPALKSFHDKLLEIEKKVKDECFENRLTWLKDDYDGMKNVVDRLFWPIVKYDKDKETGKVLGKYPPTMKLKLPYDSNTDAFTFDCYDMDGNEFDFKANMTKLKGSRARLIVQLAGLWFAGGKYGCTWKVAMAKIEQGVKQTIKFIQDSDDDEETNNLNQSDEDVDEDALHMAQGSSPVKKSITEVSESDEEDEDQEEDQEDEPQPPPPAPKKVVKPVRAPSPEPEEEETPEEDAEDVDSELEDLPPPPPPKKTAKKVTAKAK